LFCSSALSAIDLELPLQDLSGETVERFTDIQDAKGGETRHKAVRIELDDGQLMTIRSDQLWDLVGNHVVVKKTRLLRRLTSVETSETNIDLRWSEFGPLWYTASFLVFGGILLVFAGAFAIWPEKSDHID
jgi:hypothetical protein